MTELEALHQALDAQTDRTLYDADQQTHDALLAMMFVVEDAVRIKEKADGEANHDGN